MARMEDQKFGYFNTDCIQTKQLYMNYSHPEVKSELHEQDGRKKLFLYFNTDCIQTKQLYINCLPPEVVEWITWSEFKKGNLRGYFNTNHIQAKKLYMDYSPPEVEP